MGVGFICRCFFGLFFGGVATVGNVVSIHYCYVPDRSALEKKKRKKSGKARRFVAPTALKDVFKPEASAFCDDFA